MRGRDTEASSCDCCCSGNAMNITYFECVSVALGIQHAMRMRRIILSSVAWPAVQCFFHIMTQDTIIGIETLNCVYLNPLAPELFF